MGIIHPGVPQRLVQRLRQSIRIENFVETGTFRGDSAMWAARHFKNVYTIEQSEMFFHAAAEKYRDSSVSFIHDDSRAGLQQLVDLLEGASLFWLDAHWSGVEGSAGGSEQCPLLEELSIIARLKDEAVIMVDDARYFLCPPPPPHRVEEWPGLSDIVQLVLENFSDMYIVVVDDVLLIAPNRVRGDILDYCRYDSTTGKPHAISIEGAGRWSRIWNALRTFKSQL